MQQEGVRQCHRLLFLHVCKSRSSLSYFPQIRFHPTSPKKSLRFPYTFDCIKIRRFGVSAVSFSNREHCNSAALVHIWTRAIWCNVCARSLAAGFSYIGRLIMEEQLIHQSIGHIQIIQTAFGNKCKFWAMSAVVGHLRLCVLFYINSPAVKANTALLCTKIVSWTTDHVRGYWISILLLRQQNARPWKPPYFTRSCMTVIPQNLFFEPVLIGENYSRKFPGLGAFSRTHAKS